MFPQFTNEKVADSNSLMPVGTLAWAVVSVRAIKYSQSSGAQFADLELTILQGSYEGRKIFTNVMSPFDENMSEAGRQMGFVATLHMCESAGLVNVNDVASYAWLNCDPNAGPQALQEHFINIFNYLDGKAVAIKTKHDKDKNGAYPDRDGLGEWLTPNPIRSATAYKGYQALAEGKESLKPAVPTPAAPKAAGFALGAAPQTAGQQPAAGFVAQPSGIAPANRPAAAFVPAAVVPPPGPVVAGAVPSAARVGAPAGFPLPGAPQAPTARLVPNVGPQAANPAWLPPAAPAAVQPSADPAAGPGVPVAVAADGLPA